MMKKKKFKRSFPVDVLTGKPIRFGNAIDVRSAVDYVKKMGYRVLPLFFLFLPVVTAQSFMEVDLSQNYNLLILLGTLLMSILMLFSPFYLVGAGILSVIGLVMLFSGVNTLLSSIFIFFGLVALFLEGKLRT